MNRSNNAFDGALQFHLKVKKTEDGRVTVSCPAQPKVPPVTADTQSSAVGQMQSRLQRFVSSGKVDSDA
jgi:hypothetical protein